ncbi:MAG: UpxY family transcription antiterminator [Bacteroidales bacterium]|jgi:transcription antitermination factor NusG|nr:UpxY family transcription antiterminator [Bacteroidales bacterium]
MDPTGHWFAVYTKSRQEKKLEQRLKEIGIEAYVPIHKVVRQWSDRKKMVEVPLIRSYCFVKIVYKQYFDVLNTPGAVRYVWFSGKPAAIPDRQIDILRVITGADVAVDCIPVHFKPGTSVRITAGPMAGIQGELIRLAGKNRVIIRIDHLDQVLIINISPMLVEEVR